jgi:hypothetical protein
MFELIGIIIFLIIANHYGKKIPKTGKYWVTSKTLCFII